MKFKSFEKGIKVRGLYYYCSKCSRQIDYYEHLRNDGLCEICRYSSY